MDRRGATQRRAEPRVPAGMRPIGAYRRHALVELVAVRIVELARDDEFDPDRLTEATVSTFEG